MILELPAMAAVTRVLAIRPMSVDAPELVAQIAAALARRSASGRRTDPGRGPYDLARRSDGSVVGAGVLARHVWTSTQSSGGDYEIPIISTERPRLPHCGHGTCDCACACRSRRRHHETKATTSTTPGNALHGPLRASRQKLAMTRSNTVAHPPGGSPLGRCNGRRRCTPHDSRDTATT